MCRANRIYKDKTECNVYLWCSEKKTNKILNYLFDKTYEYLKNKIYKITNDCINFNKPVVLNYTHFKDINDEKNNDINFFILKYNDKEIYTIKHFINNEIYFNAKQVAKILNYMDHNQSINELVLKEDICYLKDIVTNYKSIYKNAQGHSKFLNIKGLYTYILKSKKKVSNDFIQFIKNNISLKFIN
jgi:hypothetical protein